MSKKGFRRRVAFVFAACLCLSGCGGKNADSLRQDGVYSVGTTALPSQASSNADGNPDKQSDSLGQSNPQSGESQTWESQNTEAQPEWQNQEGQNAESQSQEGQNAEGQNQEGQNVGGQNPEWQNQEGQNAGGQNQEGQNAEDQNQESQSADGQNQEGQNQEGQDAEGQNPEGQNLEGQNAGNQNAGNQNLEGRNAEGQNPEGQNPESQNAESQPQGENPENQPAGGLPVPGSVIGTDGLNYDYLNTIDNTRLVAGYNPEERDALNRPLKAVNYQGAFANYNAEFLHGDGQTVMLTFTVGDDNTTMPHILDTLAARGIRARFYVIGEYARLYPDIIRRIIDEGHILGSHSRHHPDAGMQSLSVEQIVADTMEMQNLVRDMYGYEMTEYAFPSGTFSERALATICQMGYHTVFYSFAYKDYEQSDEPDPAASLDKLLRELHPGAIYLLHGSSTTSASILNDFITGAIERGYTFVS